MCHEIFRLIPSLPSKTCTLQLEWHKVLILYQSLYLEISIEMRMEYLLCNEPLQYEESPFPISMTLGS